MKYDTYIAMQEQLDSRFTGTLWNPDDVREYVLARLAERGEPVPSFEVLSAPASVGSKPILVLR